jgi:arylformamidase
VRRPLPGGEPRAVRARDGVQIGKIELVSNTGTYVDTPFHRFPDGDDLARQPLWPLTGRPALVVRPEPEDGAAIGPEAFA